MPTLLDRFIPAPDVREYHQIMVCAPARMVFEVARSVDLRSVPMVRAIFWLRGKVLGARNAPSTRPMPFVAEMLRMGWGSLAEEPGHFMVAGAVCQPWRPDVTFLPIPAGQFETFAQPDQVKIAWTLEAEAVEPALTCLTTETRAIATDAEARAKFRRYWRIFGIGVPLIRRVLLHAVRNQAERRWRSARLALSRQH